MQQARKGARPGRDLLAALVLLAAPLAAECVPEGETVDLSFPRPELPRGEDPGHPSYWDGQNGNPQGQEVDGLRNDPMGPAVDHGDSASVPVKNDDGDLRDSLGNDQNGFGEGACIEVRTCWDAMVWETRMVWTDFSFALNGEGHGSIGFSRRAVTKYWKKRLCSGSKPVCPEGDCD
ncbi:MAG: hypothetical protein R3F17_07240 [Planctomycetota bacterium]